TYHYCIHATDLAGNPSSSCGRTFATASQTIVVDTTPPDVSLITVAPITATGATINFTTIEVGNVDSATQKELNTVSMSETKLNIPTDFVVFDTDLKKGDQGDAVED